MHVDKRKPLSGSNAADLKYQVGQLDYILQCFFKPSNVMIYKLFGSFLLEGRGKVILIKSLLRRRLSIWSKMNA